MRVALSLLTSIVAAVGISQAAVVNLDSFNTADGQEFELDAGTYEIRFVSGEYTAWNAWSRVRGCDRNGEHCSNGWLTNVALSSEPLGKIQFGRDGRFATPEQALAAALPVTITLEERESVSFFIEDSVTRDNEGGVSLEIVEAEVPLPASGLLIGTALALGAARRRQKRHHA